MTPELEAAREAYDLCCRLMTRHQNSTFCAPPVRGYRRPGSYDEGKHTNRPEDLAEHIRLVEERTAALESVRTIEADLAKPKKRKKENREVRKSAGPS